MILSKKYMIPLLSFFIIAVVCLILFSVFYKKPNLTVVSKKNPVTFKVDNKSYTIDQSSWSIYLEPGQYSYLATQTGSDVSFNGVIDIDSSNNFIEIDFGMFDKDRVIDDACTIKGFLCDIKKSDMSAKFFNNHTWVVVYKADTIILVSKRIGSEWKVISYMEDGGGYIPGTLPVVVEKEIEKSER